MQTDHRSRARIGRCPDGPACPGHPGRVTEVVQRCLRDRGRMTGDPEVHAAWHGGGAVLRGYPEVLLGEVWPDRYWKTPQGLRMLLGAFRGGNPLERIVGVPSL